MDDTQDTEWKEENRVPLSAFIYREEKLFFKEPLDVILYTHMTASDDFAAIATLGDYKVYGFGGSPGRALEDIVVHTLPFLYERYNYCSPDLLMGPALKLHTWMTKNIQDQRGELVLKYCMGECQCQGLLPSSVDACPYCGGCLAINKKEGETP